MLRSLSRLRANCWLIAASSLLTFGLRPSYADVFTLKNGLQVEGSPGRINSIHENPLHPNTTAGQVRNDLIFLVDDGLRRTFFSTYQRQAWAPGNPAASVESIKIRQRVASVGRRVQIVGPLVRASEIDEWGRRVVTMNTQQGPLDLLLGITEITPVYTRFEALHTDKPLIWDTRVATSSIPRETLNAVLMNNLDPNSPNDRLRIVRLYLQAERYQDASLELQKALQDFPELADLQKQFETLQQMLARRLLDEIELRRTAGQHARSQFLLSEFPEKGVAGETLLKVSEVLDEYRKFEEQRGKVLGWLDEHRAALQDDPRPELLNAICEEIRKELSLNTINRMADYLRLGDAKDLQPDQKIALAISGWILGSGSGTENLAVALSLVEARNLVQEYLRTPTPAERESILGRLRQLEGAQPTNLAKIIAHMKPAIETAEPQSETVPGLHELQVSGIGEEPFFRYHVQLPPEYDPYKRYPCIVTLNGHFADPSGQIDWWAGAYNEQTGQRFGQATRYGYIVIAPHWSKAHQREYEYSAREHATVLFTLRDACRRFSIDTDRVFLSGHSMGADAAWDIGISHPDLWAGVIPVCGKADKYVSHYSENARYVPLYFVCGEMDGTSLEKNGRDWDRYLQRVGYDCLVVQYLGRGHEHFYEEIQRIFEWMELHRRSFYPRELKVEAMRPWDNFFFWLELEDLADSSMVMPAAWPPKRGTSALSIEAKIYETNRVAVTQAGAGRVTVWLAPEMVNFQGRVEVEVRGRAAGTNVQPDIAVMLEDVRTRGDRQHPFWAKVVRELARYR